MKTKAKTLFLAVMACLVPGFSGAQDVAIEWLQVEERIEWNTLSTTARDALTGLTSGKPVIIYNVTTGQFEQSADGGSSWSSLSGAGASLPIADTTAVVKGSVDDTKLVRIEADGITTGTTRVITMADADISLVPGATYQATNTHLDDLADGTLSASKLDAAITRDTEWDTAAEINAATTDQDFLAEDRLGVTVQAYDADLADLADGTLTGTKVGTFTGDSGAGGAVGAVPAPSAGDAAANRYLKADGTWGQPGASGGGLVFSYVVLPYSEEFGPKLGARVYWLAEAPVAMTVTKISVFAKDEWSGATADLAWTVRKNTTTIASMTADTYDGMAPTSFSGFVAWTGSVSVAAGDDLNVNVTNNAGGGIGEFVVTIYGTAN